MGSIYLREDALRSAKEYGSRGTRATGNNTGAAKGQHKGDIRCKCSRRIQRRWRASPNFHLDPLQVMKKCWAHSPEDRPSFRNLKEQLILVAQGLTD